MTMAKKVATSYLSSSSVIGWPSTNTTPLSDERPADTHKKWSFPLPRKHEFRCRSNVVQRE